ncbi:unnamed protein product, partial [Rotaria sp. Silwood2]
MIKNLRLSLLFIYILFIYQINQSLTLSVFHSKDVSILNDRFYPINEYFQKLNQQNESPYDLIQLDNDNILSRSTSYKRDSPTPHKIYKPLLCFFNTVTCF